MLDNAEHNVIIMPIVLDPMKRDACTCTHIYIYRDSSERPGQRRALQDGLWYYRCNQLLLDAH